MTLRRHWVVTSLGLTAEEAAVRGCRSQRRRLALCAPDHLEASPSTSPADMDTALNVNQFRLGDSRGFDFGDSCDWGSGTNSNSHTSLSQLQMVGRHELCSTRRIPGTSVVGLLLYRPCPIVATDARCPQPVDRTSSQ